MKFLHPNFLWAFLFLAVPIIIHLFYFRRYKRILFSNTKFLQEIKEEKATKNKLKHLLVLATRLLALAFLVLAFAQPFIPLNKGANLSEKLVSVYLDNSFSMQAEGQGYLLFDEAKVLAEKLISSYGENNKFQILSNDFEAKHQRIVGKAEALNLLSELQVSASVQQKQTVLDKQGLGAKSFVGEKIFYQLSDFQVANDLATADSSINLNLINVQASNLRNLVVEELSFESPIQLVGQNNKLLLKISNQGNEEQSGSFQLLLNGVAKSLGNYTIAPKDFVIDTLQFTILEKGWNQGKISINDYPLTFDDDYFFSFFVEEKLKVYCIYEGQSEKYPKAVFANNDQVLYQSNSSSSIDYNKLNDQHLLVLSELKNLPSGLIEAVKTFLERGGQVLIVPNKEPKLDSYNQFLGSLDLSKFGTKKSGARKLSVMHEEHVIFEGLFDEFPKSPSLPTVQEYFELSSNLKREDILSFADGSPYLASYEVGNGRVYLLASSLAEQSSNFAQDAIFAPLVYKMAILGVKNLDISFIIEANTSIQLNELPQSAESLLKLKKDDFEVIPQRNVFNGNLSLSLPGQNLQSGFYLVYSDDEDFKAEIALNYDRKESQLNYFSLDEMKAFYADSKVNVLENNLSLLSENVKVNEEGKSFWKICIILALIFLALEVLILRFIPN